MSNLKSAWEIAMEKAKKLDDVPLAELKKKEEERCRLAGQAIVERYLISSDPRQLVEDLEKYREEERELVQKAVVSSLVKAITLGDSEKLEAAVEGIFILTGNERVKETSARIQQLFYQYRLVEREKIDEMNVAEKKVLQQMGISGNAIKAVNFAARESWRQSLKEIARPYEEELEKYKQEILTL